MPPRRALVPLALLLLLAPPLPAQQPKIDAQKLAHQFMLGRFYMPVTCARADGSLLEREEAVVFRRADDVSGFPAIRATFFGIHAPDAVRCSNLVHPELLDRRGSLYLSYEALYRPDLGVRDLSRALQRGPLEFRIVTGQLVLRGIGAPDAALRTVEFDHKGARLLIEGVAAHSDENKLLSPVAPETAPGQRSPRRFNLTVEGLEGFQFRGSYIEDHTRWR